MVSQERLLTVFVQLTNTLVADFDVVDFMQTLTETSVELLGADEAGLMLADERGDLQVASSSSEDTHVLELFELQHDEGPCLDCFRTGRAVTTASAEDALSRWPLFGAAAGRAGYQSIHAVPLRLRREVIGAMNLFIRRPGGLTTGEVSLSQGLADIATICLLQERAIQERQVVTEQLQGALNSRIVIEQAKGMVAQRFDTDVNDAFGSLRRYARRAGIPIAMVAAGITDGTLDMTLLRTG